MERIFVDDDTAICPCHRPSQVPYLTEVAEWGATENEVEVEERSAWHRLNKM